MVKRRWIAAPSALPGLAPALAAPGGAARAVSPCTGGMLSGTFEPVPGSAGAGNIVCERGSLQLTVLTSGA